MPNSTTTIGGSRRGGPTFKFYWVENGQIVAIKRYDEAESTVVPYRVFKLIAFVFPNFKIGEHVVKFQDDDDLIELTEEDCVRFNAESGDIQVYLYIFSSKEEASRTVTPPTGTHRQAQFAVPSPPVTLSRPVVSAPSPQPSATVFPKPQTEVNAKTQTGCEATQAQANPQANSSSGASQEEASESDIPHKNVVCDGCDGNIPSHRYKCLQCPDFDLCSACESSGLHPEHLMIRVPVHFVHVYGPAYRDILHRVHEAAAREFNADEVVIDLGKQLKDVLKAFGIELDHIGEGKHCDSRRKHKGKHGSFAPFTDKRAESKHHHSSRKWHRRDTEEAERCRELFTSYLFPSEPSAPAPFAPAPFAPSPSPATTAANSPPSPSPATTAANSPPASTVIAPTLIPTPVPVPASTPSAPPAPAPSVPAPSVPAPSVPAPSVPAPSVPGPSTPVTTVTDGPVYPALDNSDVIPMDEDSQRPGDWLMVDNDGAAALAVTRPVDNKITDPLPFLHSDDVVNVALEKLAMMGYKIDDPLLVHIVEDNKGDISKILDTFHG